MPDDIKMTDLTGSDPEFKRGDRRYMVFQSTQTIDFGEPAFASTIKVYKIVQGTPELLYENTDWAHRSSLQDVNAISEAKLEDSTFQANLVHGILMTGSVIAGQEFQISVEYQGFYRELTSYPDTSTGPTPTPGLMLSIVKDLQYLKYVKDPVTDVTGDTLAKVQILDEDYTGLNENNHIFNEEHQVNVPNNVYVIRPANGSFYKHDLVLTYNGTDLVENRDYIVRGVNHGKTRVSSHKSGVYEYIVLTTAIVGTVQVDYRAFGGMITANDFYSLRDSLIDVIQLLGSGQFITTENLPTQPIITEILQRLTIVEEAVRHYKQVAFTYEITNFLHNSLYYSDDNWVNVASVAHGPWTEMNPINSVSTGYFRLEVPVYNYGADFALTYNMNSGKIMLSDVSVHGTTYEDNGMSHFDTRIVPKFRIVYDSSDINHGLILQMSINGKTAGDVQVTFYDKTGSATVWDVIDTGGDKHPNTETSTTLPDGTEWVSGQGTAAVTNTVSVLGEHYTTWVGTVNVKDIEDASYKRGEAKTFMDNTWVVDGTEAGDYSERPFIDKEGLTVSHLINNNDIDISQVRGIKVKVFDRYKNQVIEESSNQVVELQDRVEPIVMYYIQDLCAISCSLTQQNRQVSAKNSLRTITNFTLVLKSQTGTNSLINDRFVLQQVDLLV